MEAHLTNNETQIEPVLSVPRRVALWMLEELRWFVRVVISAADRFYWDNGFNRAAALAYTSLLSLVPLFALSFGILSSFETFHQYVADLEQLMIEKFVPSSEVGQQIGAHLAEFSRKLSGVSVSMITFFVITALLLINAIEAALNETWQVFEPRPWAQRIGIFSAIILISPFFALSVYLFVYLQAQELISQTSDSLLGKADKYIWSFFLSFIAFVALYYLVPKAPVRVRSAIFGAFLTAFIFSLAYGGFAVYVEHASYNKLYGTIAAIPIFLVWLYIFWIIVLLGAETTYQAQHLPRTGNIWKRSIHSIGDGHMLLAMQALVVVTRSFLKGLRMPNDIELAEQLGCSSVVLKPALEALERAEIISRAASSESVISLMSNPSKITLARINEVLFKGRLSMRYPSEMAKVFGSFQLDRDPKTVTLVDIVGDSSESQA